MNRKLMKEFVHTRVGDILLSPSVFRRIYEEEQAVGNDVTLLPGLVLMKLADGEVHYVWQSGSIVVQVYQYTVQIQEPISPVPGTALSGHSPRSYREGAVRHAV